MVRILSVTNLGPFFCVIICSMIAHTSTAMVADAKRHLYPSRLESVVGSDSLVPPVSNQVRRLLNRRRLTLNYPPPHLFPITNKGVQGCNISSPCDL